MVLEDLGGILVSPKEAFRIIFAERRSVLSAFGILFLFSLSAGLGFASLVGRFIGDVASLIPNVPFVGSITTLVIASLGVGLAILDVIVWVVYSGFSAAIAKLMDGRGDFSRELIVIGYSLGVSKIAVILACFIGLFLPSLVSFIAFTLGFIVYLILFIILASIGTGVAQEISFTKGFLCIIIPPLILILVFAAIIPLMAFGITW